jgi:hypothetical protein
MNTDKKHPKPGSLTLGVLSPVVEVGQGDCKVEPALQNLCSSVFICGFGLPGCTQPK